VRSPAELTQAFRQTGLKVTPQRQLLFGLLHGNTSHPSADVLFALASEAMPGISLRTVYQTLNDLAAMGELQSIDFGTGSARFDPNVTDHQHAVCNECVQCMTSVSRARQKCQVLKVLIYTMLTLCIAESAQTARLKSSLPIHTTRKETS